MKQDLAKQLLNEHEVAGICGISVLTLRKWRSLKRGPRFLKISSLVRYRPEDVTAWIDRQAAVPCEEVAVAPLRVERGYLAVPTAPGLGIELREDVLTRYAGRDLPARPVPTPRDEGP